MTESKLVSTQAHRWKYASPVDPSGIRCLAENSAVIGVSGERASGSRVEGAFLSGMAPDESLDNFYRLEPLG